MKKLFGLIICCVSFSSCYTTHSVISKTSLDETIDNVDIELRSRGYYLIGTSTDTKNEVTVTGQSYSKYSGYGTRMDNNYITSDTYRFADTLGNSMNYTVSYQLKKSDGFYFVTNLQVKGCETSNPKEYRNLCGSKSPIKLITNLSPDESVEVFDRKTTLGAIGMIIFTGTLIILSFIY